MEHPPDLCPRREPARDRKPVLAVPLQAHVERPQAAQYQGAIVGRNRMAKLIARLAQPRPQLRRRSQRPHHRVRMRSEEHTSELQSLMRISYAVFCLKKKKRHINHLPTHTVTEHDRNTTTKYKLYYIHMFKIQTYHDRH